MDKGISVTSLVLTAFGFTPWWPFSSLWALLPISLLFIYGLMKANYEAFRKIQAERDRLLAEKQTEEQRATIAVSLQQLYSQGVSLRTAIVNSDDESSTSLWEEKFLEWRQDVTAYLELNV